MPVNDTQRKYVSDVVKGLNTFGNQNAMEFNVASISLTNANAAGVGTIPTADVEPVAVPVIFDSANDQWVIFNDADADIAAAITADDSTLPNKAPVALVVGNKFGLGFNPEDVTLDADGEPVTVLFRGANNAGVVRAGIDYAAGGVTTSPANQTAFEEQLEKQGIMVIDSAEVVTPTYTS